MSYPQNNKSFRNYCLGYSRHLPISGSATLAAGVSTQAPDNKLLLAREAIAHAATMGAYEYAALEMSSARERMDQAQIAMTSGDYAQVQFLSEQVMVATQLAEVKMRIGKTR